jgi:SnoaL-like polyketide cyclase
MTLIPRFAALLCLAASATLLNGCSPSTNQTPAASADKPGRADSTAANNARVAQHLMRFDSLDFEGYSKQNWELFHASHADNILVHYPDGHTTTGLAAHIEELKPQFVFAPDTKITAHPVKFGAGNWTSVIGTMEDTFSKPMALGNGKFIQPTGKRYKLSMSTVGRWENGKMVEEFLFWDNASFMKQIGLGK